MSLTDRAEDLIPELAAYQRRFFIAGGIGVLICLIALFINPVDFLQAYLMAYLFVLGITLGSLAFAMVHQRGGTPHLRHHDQFRRLRLGDVARSPLVFHDFWGAADGWPGSIRAGVRDRCARLAEPASTSQHIHFARSLS